MADYRKNIEQTIGALETVGFPDEQESSEEYQARFTATLNSIRVLLPLRQAVEWNDASYGADNTWLHQQLGEFEKAAPGDRTKSLRRVQERLKALVERLLEVEMRTMRATNKAEAKRRLGEILLRSEYAKKAAERSALGRLWESFLRWLLSLIPRPQLLQPGSAQRITTISQVLVVLLALVVIALVLKAFLPRLRRPRTAKKAQKLGPRVILGERLEPEQSAVDLLAEAESLARQGEIRTAIRKAYVALLVELNDRKIISLAQHKTNRDYLRAVRGREGLHAKMVKLTDSFEQHWYGLAQATPGDWVEFRTRYREALQE